MHRLVKRIEKSKLVSVLLGASFAFVAGGWAWSSAALRNVNAPIIIHFNNLRGINQVGDAGDLAKIGVLGLLMVAMNSAVAFELERRNRFWGKFVATLTLFLSVLLFIGFAAIISVN